MAKRRKTASKRSPKAGKSQTLAQAAESMILSQSNKVLDAATKRYKQFVRQAAKATNDAHKRKYLAAALSAVAIAGVVANDLKRRMDRRPVKSVAKKKKRV